MELTETALTCTPNNWKSDEIWETSFTRKHRTRNPTTNALLKRGEHIRRTLQVYPLTDGSEFQASAAERKNPDRACHSPQVQGTERPVPWGDDAGVYRAKCWRGKSCSERQGSGATKESAVSLQLSGNHACVWGDCPRRGRNPQTSKREQTLKLTQDQERYMFLPARAGKLVIYRVSEYSAEYCLLNLLVLAQGLRLLCFLYEKS